MKSSPEFNEEPELISDNICYEQRRTQPPTPGFLSGKSRGQRSLAGSNLWSHTESDTTEATQHACMHVLQKSNVHITSVLPEYSLGFPGGLVVKNPPTNAGDVSQSLLCKGPLEKEMATHSSILSWKIPQTEEPGRLQSMGLKKNLEMTQ